MPTLLHKLHIKKFRIFEDKTFHFGKYVTAIAGQNGVGKSNILGLVANCIQYKKKGQRKESFFSPKQFRAEFHELFKGSAEHDRSGSGLMRFTFSDRDTRECRITWQKIHGKDAPQENIQGDASPDTKDDQQKRFRIIPYRDTPGANRTHTKKEMAPIYLGLSRLYPVGESSHCSAVGLQHENPEATQWIVDQALQILSVPIGTNSSVEMDSVKISDVKRKTGVGFKADTYDALANSAGQDNIGQILLAIWKIKALKEDLGDDFPGAILLIDEFDATLHPASQRKLLDLLIREAKKTEFQTVFTTHSLYLLNLLSGKVEHNAKGLEDVNDIEINYLTTANGFLECLRNPTFSVIGNDLKEQLAKYPQRIKIYTEDNEARWFLRHILEKLTLSERVQILDDAEMSCTYAEKLLKADRTYFQNVLFILDGDAGRESKVRIDNFVYLPGTVRPESVFMDFLCDADQAAEFCSQTGAFESGYTVRNFASKRDEITLKSQNSDKKERDFYKEWFEENIQSFDELNLFEYWCKANSSLVDDFRKKFKDAFNHIAKRLRIKFIS